MQRTFRAVVCAGGLTLGSLAVCCAPRLAAQSYPARLVIRSQLSDSGLGFALASAGDLDGDGAADLLLGNEAADSARACSSVDAHVLHEWKHFSLGSYGKTVAGGSDLDSDGVPDVLIANIGFSTITPNLISAYSGATDLELWHLLPASSVSFDGSSLSFVPDLNDDGVDDVVAGNRLFSKEPALTDPGRILVLDGRTGIVLSVIEGTIKDEELGYSVAGLHDVDGDGAGDFAASARQGIVGPGYVRLFSGRTGAVLHHWTPEFLEKSFGQDITCPGDIDGDGSDDLVVGILGYPSFGGPSIGRVRAYSGTTGLPIGQVDGTPDSVIGWWVRGGGDVDGDGIGDLALGGTSVRVISGSNGKDLFTYRHPNAGFGAFTHRAILLPRADGRADVAVSLPGAWFSNGEALIFSRDDGHWKHLGGALPGAHGSPQLDGVGWPEAGQGIVFRITKSAPLAPLLLIGGTAVLPVPFHGGELVPSPQFLLPGITNGAGTLELVVHWPNVASIALVPGAPFVVQAWIADRTGPQGFAASDAIFRLMQ